MRIADQVVAWCVLALGAVHSAFTAKYFAVFNQQAMWFLSAGLLLMLLGAVNLLRVRYGAMARGVRTICAVANVVVLAFVVATASTLRIRSNPAALVLVALIAALTVLSLRPHAERA